VTATESGREKERDTEKLNCERGRKDRETQKEERRETGRKEDRERNREREGNGRREHWHERETGKGHKLTYGPTHHGACDPPPASA
jgi:hypothetical protein